MTASRLPTAATILDALLDRPAREDSQPADLELAQVMDPILALHHSNVLQWAREDDARDNQADDAVIAAAKRDIDELNISRHGFIEAIDRAFLAATNPREGTPLVTESPGMAIDRLSVLVIRLASTEARTGSGRADTGLYADRLPQLRMQLSSLEEAIATLFADLTKGSRRFLAHESLKLYGQEVPDHIADCAQRHLVELVTTTIETDDKLISHHRRMSDAQRVWAQCTGELGGYRCTRGQHVQITSAPHTAGYAVRHDRGAPASPGEVGAESGGRHDGSTG